MGNNFTLAVGHLPETHVRIYKNLLQLKSPATRLQMLETLLAGQEYVATAKQTGFYGPLLAYMAAVRRGDAATLPGENASAARSSESRVALVSAARGDTSKHTKAISFFSQCLQVLGLEEEVALNEQALKAAYKKASMKAHPDKGGSEEEFDTVTRAYAFLGEILRRVRGGRNEMVNVSEESPARLVGAREQNSDAWKMKGEPVKLNPKNLNMDTFNRTFEETKLPDPDGDGYGDWLKGQDAPSSGTKFTGKFNRSVFNDAFEGEIRSRAQGSRANANAIQNRQPEALTMAPHLGIELGRDRPEDFTGANLNGLKYTDLKKAYTTDSTFSHQVSDVKVSNRSFDAAASERKSAPQPLSAHEMESIAEGERHQALRQQQQLTRISEEDRRITEHFQKMQRYVITNH